VREYISAYLKKDFVTSLSAEEMKAIFQLLRVQNSLTYHLLRLVETHEGERTIVSGFQQVEETFIIASVIREAMKELFGSGRAFHTLKGRIMVVEVATKLTSLEAYYLRFKTEVNLLFLDMIRNQFSFHFKKDIYEGNIIDGTATTDMQISISLGEKNQNIVYVAPVNSAFFQVVQFIKKHNIASQPDKYLFDTVYYEAISLYEFINAFVADIVKGNAFKKTESY